MWMIGEAACEGMIVSVSIRSKVARTFFCSVLKIDSVFRRMLMRSEAETARSIRAVAENTNDVSSTRW